MYKKLTTECPELHPVAVKFPWYHLGVDFVDPISRPCCSGNWYILTVCPTTLLLGWAALGAFPPSPFAFACCCETTPTCSSLPKARASLRPLGSTLLGRLLLVGSSLPLHLAPSLLTLLQVSKDFTVRLPIQILSSSSSPGQSWQYNVRKHLMHCFEIQCVSPFPIMWKRRRGDVVKWSTIIQISCTCRMPEQPGSTMVECCWSKQWFHVGTCTCVTVTPYALGSGAKLFCIILSGHIKGADCVPNVT